MYVLAFKRDNHLETSSSVKQKTPRPSASVISVSRMTSFSVIIGDYILCLITKSYYRSRVWSQHNHAGVLQTNPRSDAIFEKKCIIVNMEIKTIVIVNGHKS